MYKKYIWAWYVLCRGTKNHNLIDNMNMKLAQTQKKISDVKRKCTETAKTCLQMHAAENVSKALLLFQRVHHHVVAIRSSLMSTSFIYWGSQFYKISHAMRFPPLWLMVAVSYDFHFIHFLLWFANENDFWEKIYRENKFDRFLCAMLI